MEEMDLVMAAIVVLLLALACWRFVDLVPAGHLGLQVRGRKIVGLREPGICFTLRDGVFVFPLHRRVILHEGHDVDLVFMYEMNPAKVVEAHTHQDGNVILPRSMAHLLERAAAEAIREMLASQSVPGRIDGMNEQEQAAFIQKVEARFDSDMDSSLRGLLSRLRFSFEPHA